MWKTSLISHFKHITTIHVNRLFTHSQSVKVTYVTLDHKTSHKGQFIEIEIYTYIIYGF